ncbi:MAG: hypothetical protein EKK46_13350, partial [Rhodocyclaceae bacterium]
SSWGSLVTSFLADVNGDGKADFIAQQSDGLYVALSTGTGLGASTKWVNGFGYSQGYSDQTTTPIFLLDVNGDGLADAVGFASDGVYVALSNGAGFGSPTKWISDFTTGAGGWTTMDTYPRTLADVNGDGRPDVVGFGSNGVYVALNNGTGFGARTQWTGDFGTTSTVPYATNSANPRLVQDVNGDGLPDIIGFGNGGTYVALNTGTSFAASTLWLADFGVNAGYTTSDTYPRTLADVNGDGLPDVIGFKSDGTYVAINTGTGLQTATKWLADFGTATTIAYSSQKGFPRYVMDVNGDGKADIIGFAAAGVQVALGTGTGLNASSQWVAGFGSNAGYTTTTPRQLADVDGDGFPDIVGTLVTGGSTATNVARTARTTTPDLIATLGNGMGTISTVTYTFLGNGGLYTRGTTATYPQADITVPFYVVQSAKTPNALGSNFITHNYQYGGLRVDITGRGLVGFGWVQATQADTGIATRTDYRQDWPYSGLPFQTMKTLPGYGNNGLLSLVTNSYGCLTPQTGVACTITAGNRYFPYLSQSNEANWESNGTALPTVQTANTFDGYGNATAVTVASSDGFTKTTTNIYSNDATNWFLGRLTQSQVASTTGAVNQNMPTGVFTFNQTISTNTNNYNLRNAAIAAGWNQSDLLAAKVTVNPGVVVGSTSPSTPAFDTGYFPTGAAITLINNGIIAGAGGAGGSDGTWFAPTNSLGFTGNPGQPGGAAMRAQALMNIANDSGTIGGGGGGGGAGASRLWGFAFVKTGGGGGGGGAGQVSGAGGAGAIGSAGYSGVNGANGSSGTPMNGGVGGGGGTYVLYYQPVTSGSGGNGGNLGMSGDSGTVGTANTAYIGGAGGSPGAAVVGNANIT